MFATKPKFEIEAETLACLRLARTKGMGPITFKRLIDRAKTARKALAILPELSKAGGKRFEACPEAAAIKEAEALYNLGGQIIGYTDERYPDRLRQIDDAPIVLSALGNVDLLTKPQMGVVGARNASLNGRKLTHKFAQEIGAQGYVVTSGMARGIDTAAHEGALKSGTIAVVAGGIDQIYPRENTRLYEMLSREGLIVAENALGTEPKAQHFPRRNRIISGLSLGVLVVEATERSGSLITARMALEQGRDVMAVPGYPSDPRAAGPNKLIRDGAALIRSAEDIVEELQSAAQSLSYSVPVSEQTLFEDAEDFDFGAVENARDVLLNQLTTEPVSIDLLIRDCHISTSEGLTTLLALELAGKVQRLPGNRVCRINE